MLEFFHLSTGNPQAIPMAYPQEITITNNIFLARMACLMSPLIQRKRSDDLIRRSQAGRKGLSGPARRRGGNNPGSCNGYRGVGRNAISFPSGGRKAAVWSLCGPVHRATPSGAVQRIGWGERALDQPHSLVEGAYPAAKARESLAQPNGGIRRSDPLWITLWMSSF